MNSLPAAGHSWLPRPSCDASCLRAAAPEAFAWLLVTLRGLRRGALLLLLLSTLPLLSVALRSRPMVRNAYFRLLLWSCGVRIRVSGEPMHHPRGVLVVSGHVSWLDAITIGAAVPAKGRDAQPMSFVARADMCTGRVVGRLGRILRVIPIQREHLRTLPSVVRTVADRLRAGHAVVAFPEGTTWCGQSHHGPAFYPAMFQAAIDAGRPVQPLQLSYHHRDGSTSTVPAFVGDDTLLRSLCRLVVAAPTLARVHVEPLQLPNTNRRDLAGRCHAAVYAGATGLAVDGDAAVAGHFLRAVRQGVAACYRREERRLCRRRVS